ncbi:hypothetical protein G6F35_014593 [Rhizopus arrhizus]|nr:hypothetical protein G6F35_014593 [Rhizopus arrhizus]
MCSCNRFQQGSERMSRTLSLAALAASLSLILGACGGKAPATAGDAGPSGKPDASTASSDAQQQLTAKLNAYIGCFNALDSKTHGSIESYTRWIKDRLRHEAVRRAGDRSDRCQAGPGRS